jgi:hypothetical protein
MSHKGKRQGRAVKGLAGTVTATAANPMWLENLGAVHAPPGESTVQASALLPYPFCMVACWMCHISINRSLQKRA